MIKDSGERTAYDTGAVRDMKKGKGRCDLLPLDIISDLLRDEQNNPDMILAAMNKKDIRGALTLFAVKCYNGNMYTMLLEVAIHFEQGALKYSEDNWKKGIPLWSYIDSAVRHYMKWLRGDKDEHHERAFVWNCLCYLWTAENLTVSVDELIARA